MTLYIGVASSEPIGIPEESQRIFSLQAPALEAYALLHATFTINEDGSEVYPNGYAGAWIDDYKLHIAVKQDDLNVSARYRELLNGYNCVVFETAEHSLNELDIIRYSMYEELKYKYPFTSHFVDVKSNKIYFGLSETNNDLILSSINESSTALKTGAIVASDLFIFGKEEQIQRNAEYIGGMEINMDSKAESYLTLGASGTFYYGGTNIPGFITSGHYLSLSDSIYQGGSVVGRIMILQFQNNGIGDYAIASRIGTSHNLSNKVYHSTGGTLGYITGTLDDLPVGAAVARYGTKTGYGLAIVTAQNVSINDGVITTRGLTRATSTMGKPEDGDSGGPFFTSVSGMNFNFVGVFTGTYKYDGITHLVFTPHVRFKNEFTVRTN
jgi:hypothetical protein